MSIIDKVKEMFSVAAKDEQMSGTKVPPQAGAPGTTTGKPEDMRNKMEAEFRTKLEAGIREGIERGARAADSATGGRFTEQIKKAADAAKNAADKIDGQTGTGMPPGPGQTGRGPTGPA
ncbi:Rv0909 family putative TA system antitoxin [Rhizohabitans arisaemae]|uniref:Rv0909 family putative TA system antitoxin n=1 Tax=Rhizohabitans arisaemae TaxID=2720610 RepID=UPI0024B1E3FE|nr:Rv0909 family putative TA system antitoxin [Rhizohabitans arisaemae]